MKRSPSRDDAAGRQRWRHWFVLAALSVGAVALLARAVYLQVIDQEFLEKQGDARILRVAKLSFIRLQAANDARNLNDLRSFTTPEMFAHLQLDLHERPAGEQVTEIIHVDTQVLDVANEPEQQVVSVRFTGQLREEAGAAPVAFNEVWHLVKPHGDNASWVIAGIEQLVA